MSIKIQKLEYKDLDKFIALIKLFEKVFEMKNFVMPDKEHLIKILSKNDFIVFVALKNSEVIAGLTAYTLEQYYNRKPLAYIYDLAVDTEYLRQGIGRKLISSIKGFCKRNNYEEMFVQADKVDDYALGFYRSTKPSDEEDVSHFYYNLT